METWQIITGGLILAVFAYLVALYFAFKRGGMPDVKDAGDQNGHKGL